MTHRGPFQPLTFCDSVILWFILDNTDQNLCSLHLTKHDFSEGKPWTTGSKNSATFIMDIFPCYPRLKESAQSQFLFRNLRLQTC